MGFNFGGLFSSESKKSTSTNSTATTYADSRMVNDGGSFGLNTSGASQSGTNNTTVLNVATLDNGAIGGAFDVAKQALMANSDVASNAIAGMGIVSTNALNTVNDVSANSLASMGIVSSRAFDTADHLFNAVGQMISGQQQMTDTSLKSVSGAMTELNRQAVSAMNSNVSLARDLASSANQAYSDATTQASGTKNIVMVGLVVVGLAAAVAFWKK